MNKLYRFMKEYADYQKKQIKASDRTEYEKNILTIRVNNIVMNYRRGFVTVGDAMKSLAELDYNIRYGIEEE